MLMWYLLTVLRCGGDQFINTLRPRQNGRRFPDDIFKYILLNESVWISLKISLKFIPKLRIKNIPALVQIMAWRRPGDKPLSEPMMGNSLTHICVTRPQWVKATCDVSKITHLERHITYLSLYLSVSQNVLNTITYDNFYVCLIVTMITIGWGRLSSSKPLIEPILI